MSLEKMQQLIEELFNNSLDLAYESNVVMNTCHCIGNCSCDCDDGIW